MNVVLYARARRGLGHLVRLANIAVAIRSQDSACRVTLAHSYSLPPGLVPSTVDTTLVGSLKNDDAWLSLAELGPDLLVFDTMLPADLGARLQPLNGRPHVALVLRELLPEALAELRANPALALVERVLIPHEAHEFNPGFDNQVHVGPIQRATMTSQSSAPRSSPLVLTTAGGGGHRALCAAFFETVIAADRLLRRDGVSFTHELLTGPRYDGALPLSPGILVERFDPHLVERFTTADVVIARAGYNTVHELVANGARCVLVPGNPGLDDQRLRATRAASAGRIHVVEPGDASGLAAAVKELIAAPRPATPAAALLVDDNGARRAASILLDVARAPRGVESVPHVGDDAILAAVRGSLQLADEATYELQRQVVDRVVHTGRLERIALLQDGQLRARMFAKTYGSPRKGKDVFRASRALLRTGAPIARPLAYIEQQSLAVCEEVDGTRLDELLLRDDAAASTEAFEAVGRTLARLHLCDAIGLRSMRLQQLVRDLRPRPDAVVPTALDRAMREIRLWLCAAEDPVDRLVVACHGDLHPRQIFVAGRTVRFIDLDHVGACHPMFDVANLEMLLWSKQLPQATMLIDTLVAGWREYVDPTAARDIEARRIYRVWTLLRLAVKAVRIGGVGAVERAQRCIGRAVLEVEDAPGSALSAAQRTGLGTGG